MSRNSKLDYKRNCATFYCPGYLMILKLESRKLESRKLESRKLESRELEFRKLESRELESREPIPELSSHVIFKKRWFSLMQQLVIEHQNISS